MQKQKEKVDLMRAEIFRGRQHKLVFLVLEEKALMVSEIMKKVNYKLEKTKDGKTLTLRETSRALKWLAKKGYAKCLNPSSEHGVKGIVYRFSIRGKKVQKLDSYN
jgi:hypothetical protein